MYSHVLAWKSQSFGASKTHISQGKENLCLDRASGRIRPPNPTISFGGGPHRWKLPVSGQQHCCLRAAVPSCAHTVLLFFPAHLPGAEQPVSQGSVTLQVSSAPTPPALNMAATLDSSRFSSQKRALAAVPSAILGPC